MKLQVLVHAALLDPPLYVESTEKELVLGRAAEADVRLPDPTVSPRHAKLRRRGRSYLVEDCGSTNGTALLGTDGSTVWLESGAPRVVTPGGRLLLGQVELELRYDESAEGTPSADLARDLVTAGLLSVQAEISEASIEAALEELTTGADERIALQRDDPPPVGVGGPADDGGVVSEASERSSADWAIAGLASLILVLGASGLYWLLR